MLFTKKGESVT